MHSNSLFRQIIKVIWFHLIFVLAFSISTFAQNKNNNDRQNHPVYSPKDINLEALKKSVEPLMRMTLKEVIAEVPEESGIFFIGCPNCHSGAQEMNVLGWKPGMGSKVRCNYCKMFRTKNFLTIERK